MNDPIQQPSKELVASLARFAQHGGQCAVELWEPEDEEDFDMPDCSCGLNLLIAQANAYSTSEPPAGQWWCETCRCSVEPVHVTHDETHDLRAGGCGQHVFVRATLPPLDDLRRMLCAVGVVGNIDGHDVVRRDSIIELIDRGKAAQPRDLVQRVTDLERALVYSAFHQHATPQYHLPERVALIDNDTVEVRFSDDRRGPKVLATWPPRTTATKCEGHS